MNEGSTSPPILKGGEKSKSLSEQIKQKRQERIDNKLRQSQENTDAQKLPSIVEVDLISDTKPSP